MSAALNLPTRFPSTPLRPWLFYCLFGLLSVTGLRISEALNLKVEDIDLEQQVLTIRSAKFGKSRLVPVHASTASALADCLRRREEFLQGRQADYLFISNLCHQLSVSEVHKAFNALSVQIGIRTPNSSHGPRLHDFRHRFAALTLLSWYQNGEDAEQKLPVLTTYLGHVHVAHTYWYLSDWPELMAQAMTRLERRWEDLL